MSGESRRKKEGEKERTRPGRRDQGVGALEGREGRKRREGKGNIGAARMAIYLSISLNSGTYIYR